MHARLDSFGQQAVHFCIAEVAIAGKQVDGPGAEASRLQGRQNLASRKNRCGQGLDDGCAIVLRQCRHARKRAEQNPAHQDHTRNHRPGHANLRSQQKHTIAAPAEASNRSPRGGLRG